MSSLINRTERKPAGPMHRHPAAFAAWRHLSALLIVGRRRVGGERDARGRDHRSGVRRRRTDVKKVQHQVGGIVAELNVKNGDRVEAGAVLIRLRRHSPGASLTMVSKTLESGRAARKASPEQESADIHTFPPELS